MNSITYKNASAWCGGKKMYLNSRKADVFFTFQSGNVKVPAHKCVLSSMSSVFQSMFNGTISRKNIVQITDTSSEVFTEFLQFFYLKTVKITAENALEMMNLGKNYAVASCLKACTEFCKLTLTLDSMCWGYELAILFELDDLRMFCEQKICENPEKIFKSISFLFSDPDLLHHILQLDLLCDETIVFDGCIAWVKEACIKQELDENNVKNLRTQLGDLFFEIHFGNMNVEDFYERYCLYRELFSVDEFEDILTMIALKEFQSEKFNRNTKTDDKLKETIMCN